MSLVRGEHPARAWSDTAFQDGYAAAFGDRYRARLVALANRLQAYQYETESAWNAEFCRRVREAVSIPVLCEGGIRQRSEMDQLLDSGCSMVGMGRPFYAEPRLPARLLDSTAADDPQAACESCNNCTIPQVTGAPGICRTPSVLEQRDELKQTWAYERSSNEE